MRFFKQLWIDIKAGWTDEKQAQDDLRELSADELEQVSGGVGNVFPQLNSN